MTVGIIKKYSSKRNFVPVAVPHPRDMKSLTVCLLSCCWLGLLCWFVERGWLDVPSPPDPVCPPGMSVLWSGGRALQNSGIFHCPVSLRRVGCGMWV